MKDDKKAAKKVRRQKIGLSILCVFLALVLVAMTWLTIKGTNALDRINREDPNIVVTNPPDWTMPTEPTDPHFTGPVVAPEDVEHNTVPDNQIIKDENVINILLVGQDKRPGQGRQRSDSMILCSFNLKTGTVSMISFLRDTYVYIPGYGSEKLNAAYAYGGFNKLFETLRVNFGVSIDAGIEVDFNGFAKIIDLLGGVTINITQKESDYMKVNWGMTVPVGNTRLNGSQALYYSRIRKLEGGDAMRTQRQRKVLMSLMNEYKNQPLDEMLDILYEILPMLTVTMTDSEIIRYARQLFPLLADADVVNQQIPIAGTFTDKTVGTVTATKVIDDMDANRQLLKSLLTN